MVENEMTTAKTHPLSQKQMKQMEQVIAALVACQISIYIIIYLMLTGVIR